MLDTLSSSETVSAECPVWGTGDDMVDRIAMIPGQLTAHDFGGLEILALRREAEAALGDAFDIREFYDRVDPQQE